MLPVSILPRTVVLHAVRVPWIIPIQYAPHANQDVCHAPHSAAYVRSVRTLLMSQPIVACALNSTVARLLSSARIVIVQQTEHFSACAVRAGTGSTQPLIDAMRAHRTASSVALRHYAQGARASVTPQFQGIVTIRLSALIIQTADSARHQIPSTASVVISRTCLQTVMVYA